ncbi:MAG: LysM peptidoglycan-binding domain-containing protein [Anaerolineae bacterium]|nr:LysM peptidoglycan-binding domain-containing protein [Anaerolineae bacterium]
MHTIRQRRHPDARLVRLGRPASGRRDLAAGRATRGVADGHPGAASGTRADADPDHCADCGAANSDCRPCGPCPRPAPDPGYVYGGGVCRNTTYVVQRGDNLFRIALRYGTTVASIARLNGISNTALINSGRRLAIYACGQWSGGRVYVVQPGDTLYRIAVRFGTTVHAIQLANRLSSSFIASGWTLAIP